MTARTEEFVCPLDRVFGVAARRLVLSLVAVLTLAAPGAARASLFATDKLDVSADFRVRLEADWDSRQADGSERDDRTRLRARARLALRYDQGEHLQFGMRLRSGADDSHQSPHITLYDFDGNDTGAADFNLDRWYVRAKGKTVWGWVGRNDFPFWKQNEMFWDDDVTPVGVAGGWGTAAGGSGKLSFNAGLFSLPVGMRDFSGRLAAGQLVYAADVGGGGGGGGGGLTLAGGLYDFAADPDDPDASRLQRGNGGRDYRIAVVSLQGRLSAGARPLTLGADLLRNTTSYRADDPDPFTRAHRDDRDGYVLSATLGRLNGPGDWLAAYYYAHIEAFAVNSSYAEDDWVRWGSAVETRASDLAGHELRFAYAATDHLQVMARLYLVEAITTVEDGNRFRIDLNFKF